MEPHDCGGAESNRSTSLSAKESVDAGQESAIAATQERLSVDKRTVETGAVRVRKVVSEEIQSIPLRLRAQHVEVRRVPMHELVEKAEEPRREGNTLVIPVYGYEPVVKMQLVLKEEIRVTTTESDTSTMHDVPVRSEELIVERREGSDGPWLPDADQASDAS